MRALVLAGTFLLPFLPEARSATLEATVPVSVTRSPVGSPPPEARVRVRVGNGRIRAMSFDLPVIALPNVAYWQFGREYVHEGVEGELFDGDIDPSFAAKSAIRFRGFRPHSAVETQTDHQRFTHSGVATWFLPDDGGESVLLSEDLTPYEKEAAGSTRGRAKIIREKSGEGLFLRIRSPKFGKHKYYFGLCTIAEVYVWLTPIGKDRWSIEFRISRAAFDLDYWVLRTYKGEARLRGKAEIDLPKRIKRSPRRSSTR